MLLLAKKLHQLNFEKLMQVYAESNRENAELMYPDLSAQQGILRVEQSFWEYLASGFFPVTGAVYAIWTEGECYMSALRLEPYEDGLLLEALETAPEYRGKGYAEKLIREVQAQVSQKIYSHVSKKNTPSLKAHQKCGFVQVLDYAKYIDGSVVRNAVTLCYK